MSETVRITVSLPKSMVDALDELVKKGVYKDRSHAVRQAVVSLLSNHWEVLSREDTPAGGSNR